MPQNICKITQKNQPKITPKSPPKIASKMHPKCFESYEKKTPKFTQNNPKFNKKYPLNIFYSYSIESTKLLQSVASNCYFELRLFEIYK